MGAKTKPLDRKTAARLSRLEELIGEPPGAGTRQLNREIIESLSRAERESPKGCFGTFEEEYMSVPGIMVGIRSSESTVRARLKALERKGYVKREMNMFAPSSVAYALTETGWEMARDNRWNGDDIVLD